MQNKNEFRLYILRSLQTEFGDDIDINDNQTIEKSYGWIVFYNSKEFLRTGDPMVALMSNAPILCTWEGAVYPLPMHCTVSEAVAILESQYGLSGR